MQTCRPVRAKAFNTKQLTKLLPLQGALLIAIIPRALPWAKSFCPLPLLYPSASDFQFRYAPVTVGSGRVGLTCETCIYKISYQILFGFTVEYVLVRKKFFYEKSVKVSFFLQNVKVNN